MYSELSLEEKAARIKLFRQECNFVTGAATKNSIPKSTLPEIAFVGKSNVGKSSLINSILGRKALARVSRTPGRTRQINFFSLADKLMLVDLPGYGYAKVSMSEHRNWENLIFSYFISRKNLVIICLLIDARRGVKPNDLAVMDLFEINKIKFQIVLTKMDKISKSALEIVKDSVRQYMARYRYFTGELITTSARGSDGTQELRLSLGQYRAAN